MEDMRKHIFRPFPDLNSLPTPANKEERLKIIVSNLEKHQQGVRSSMLAEAGQKVQALRSEQGADKDMDVDAMPSDHRRFIANMKAPYTEGSGDPCLLHGTIPSVDQAIKQAPVPAEVQVAQDLTQQMDAYDKHATQTQEYYRKALRRQVEARGDPEPMQQGSRAPSENRDPRRRPPG